AFLLEAALLQGLLQLVCRPATRQFFRPVVRGKVLADDFLLLVTRNGLRAGVPACNLAFAVEQNDRVVLYRRGHEPKQLRVWFGTRMQFCLHIRVSRAADGKGLAE